MKKDCKNCGVQLQGQVCHNCGQPQVVERWSTAILFQQFINQLTNIEKGFLFTAKELFAHPGRLMHDYWRGKTVVYYNPFRYLLIWTAINLLISFWLGIDDMIQESIQPASVEENFGETRMLAADQKFDSWINFLILLVIPVLALMSYWMFKKKGQNYAEHLIMNSYITGQQALLSSFTQFIYYFIPALFSGFFVLNFLIGLAYNTFVFTNTFKERWWIVLLKALLIGIVGLIVYGLLVFLFSALAIAFS